MAVSQISVFLENKSGQIAEIARLLAGAGVDLRAINVAEAKDYGVLRLIADKPALAERTLAGGGYVVSKTDVAAVAVPDEPGGLCRALEAFEDAGISIEYMYSVFGHEDGMAYMIFRVEEYDRAAAALEERGIRIVDPAAMGLEE